jgi:hypothetical protein
MSICTKCDRRLHVLHTYRTLQLTQQDFLYAGELRLHVGCTKHYCGDCIHLRFLKIWKIKNIGIFRLMTLHNCAFGETALESETVGSEIFRTSTEQH